MKVLHLYLGPSAANADLNLQVVRRDINPGQLCLASRYLTHLKSPPELKLRILGHALPGQLLVLQLGPFVPGLAPGSGGRMQSTNASVPLVLVLAALAP